jgi:hypothetical protein
MYQKSRKILFANAFLCVVEVAVAVALVVIEFTKTVRESSELPRLPYEMTDFICGFVGAALPNSPSVYGSCFSLSPREIAVVLLARAPIHMFLQIFGRSRMLIQPSHTNLI